ncbi:MAG: hypothetical protein WBA31_07725 [Candidatus Dormiibacterota bacterium]
MRAELRPRYRGGLVPFQCWLLLLAALVGALAYLDNLVWVFVPVYSALLVVSLAAAWSWWCARHLRIFRETREGALGVGQQLVERFILENDSGLPIRLVEIRDHSRVPGTRASRVVSLAPRQVISWESSRQLSSRGRYELGPTELRVADPLGLFPRQLVHASRDTLVVYPALVPIAGRSLPGGVVSGDILILLDLRHENHRGQGPDGSLECAVTVAASVAHTAAAQGRSVALATSDKHLSRIPSGRGALHERNLMDYLASAADDGKSPFAEIVRREMEAWHGRGGVVLITPDRGSEWVEEAAAGSRPGQRALAVFLDPAGFSTRVGSRAPAQWQLALDLWVVQQGDDLGRLDTRHGRAVI